MAGTLYVVATPLGNLSDASPRALEVLRAADLIACEDTRTTRKLLGAFGIATPTLALHEHNERARAASLVEELRQGRQIALVSDAGTPAVSDPGAWLVAAAHEAGIRVVPIPGPSAAAAAFSAAGFAAPGYVFAGFLPKESGPRRKALRGLSGTLPVVLFEAPHRIEETLADLLHEFGPAREVVICREITKKFEEVRRMPLGEAGAWIAADAHRLQGEYALVLAAALEAAAPGGIDAATLLDGLLEVLSPSDAARLAARLTGRAKADLYQLALDRRRPAGRK